MLEIRPDNFAAIENRLRLRGRVRGQA